MLIYECIYAYICIYAYMQMVKEGGKNECDQRMRRVGIRKSDKEESRRHRIRCGCGFSHGLSVFNATEG